MFKLCESINGIELNRIECQLWSVHRMKKVKLQELVSHAYNNCIADIANGKKIVAWHKYTCPFTRHFNDSKKGSEKIIFDNYLSMRQYVWIAIRFVMANRMKSNLKIEISDVNANMSFIDLLLFAGIFMVLTVLAARSININSHLSGSDLQRLNSVFLDGIKSSDLQAVFYSALCSFLQCS